MKKFLAAAASVLMFFWGGAKAAQKPEAPHIVMTMVVLDTAELPDAKAIAAYIRETWPFAASLGEAEVKDDTIFFGFTEDKTVPKNKELIFVSLVPAPIPSGDLEYPCATALGWPSACAALGAGKAHLIISVMGGEYSTIERHMRATMITRACLDLTKGIGVYWGTAATVWSRDQFDKMSANLTPEDPPLFMWMGIKISADDGGTTTVLTSGLPSFGRMNVEVKRSHKPSADVFELVGDIATYLMKSDDVIRDGDTVGHGNDERIRVEYAPSLTGSGATVFRLNY